MHRGYIKTFRSLEDWVLYKDSEAVHLLTHLMIKAQHKDTKIDHYGKPFTIKAGQLLTGRKKLHDETGINESKIQRLLVKLENFGEIEQQTNNKDRLITLVKWEQFQSEPSKRTANEQQVNNKRTTSEQQVNTKQECIKNEKECIRILLEPKSDAFVLLFFDFVKMRRKFTKK